jgi:regulator of sigma E protease
MNSLASLLCNLPLLLIAIVGIGLLIVFHELGHFLFCKLFNVYTPSFSIGFGPRLIEKKIGDTVFALSAIPFGGYVEMAGSAEVGQGEQVYAYATDERSFNRKPYWQKMVIISGGIVFNIIFAYIALTLLLFSGSPCINGLSWCMDKPTVIYTITPDSPAAKAGLQPKDKILAINNTPVTTIAQLSEQLKQTADTDVTLLIERDKVQKTVPIHIGSRQISGTKLPVLGVPYWYLPPLSLSQALATGWTATWSMISQVLGAFKGLTKSTEGLGGPVLLIATVTQCVGLGSKVFLFILAFISVNLAVFNVLPLPIFDGGQALFFTIEALLGKPLSDTVRYKIHYYTWLLVLALMAYLTYKDIFSLLGWR